MDADAWNRLAAHSGALVHHASRLLGVLTQPAPSRDPPLPGPVAAEAGVALAALLADLAAAPELAAHARTMQRLDASLAAWRRCVAEASALAPRYQTALLQQAAQAITSGLHLEALAASESVRRLVLHGERAPRAGPPAR